MRAGATFTPTRQRTRDNQRRARVLVDRGETALQRPTQRIRIMADITV